MTLSLISPGDSKPQLSYDLVQGTHREAGGHSKDDSFELDGNMKTGKTYENIDSVVFEC